MKQAFFSLVLVFLVVLVSGGCDSGQYGQETKTEPKAESQPMAEGETPPAGEMAKVEGALMAPEGAPGASDNHEGVKHFEKGHWDIAKEHFNKALAANAKLAEAHYNLALALDKLGDHGEATNHFKMALDLAPEDPRIKDSGILQAHISG